MPDIITGGGLFIHVTPFRIKSAGGGGGGSFTTPPIRFIDATYGVLNPLFAEGGIRFAGSTFQPGRMSATIASASYRDVDDPGLVPGSTQPQWHEDEPSATDAADYEVGWISEEGDALTGSPSGVGTPPTSGLFYQLNAQRDFFMTRPATAPGRKINTSVYQIRRVSDSVVMAQATIVLDYERT